MLPVVLGRAEPPRCGDVPVTPGSDLSALDLGLMELTNFNVARNSLRIDLFISWLLA
jgi:hypothetical protein